MAKEKKFDDPLEDIDPIMSQAFSTEDAPKEEVSEAPDLTESSSEAPESTPEEATEEAPEAQTETPEESPADSSEDQPSLVEESTDETEEPFSIEEPVAETEPQESVVTEPEFPDLTQEQPEPTEKTGEDDLSTFNDLDSDEPEPLEEDPTDLSDHDFSPEAFEAEEPELAIDDQQESIDTDRGINMDNILKTHPEQSAPTESDSIADVQFPDLAMSDQGKPMEKDVFSNIPITIGVELGRSKVSLKQVFELTEGAIIELDRMVGEPLDLVVNEQVVAQGEVVAIDNNYGLRITNIIANIKQ